MSTDRRGNKLREEQMDSGGSTPQSPGPASTNLPKTVNSHQTINYGSAWSPSEGSHVYQPMIQPPSI